MDGAHGTDVGIRDADMPGGMEESDSPTALQVIAIVLQEGQVLHPVVIFCRSQPLQSLLGS